MFWRTILVSVNRDLDGVARGAPELCFAWRLPRLSLRAAVDSKESYQSKVLSDVNETDR